MSKCELREVTRHQSVVERISVLEALSLRRRLSSSRVMIHVPRAQHLWQK